MGAKAVKNDVYLKGLKMKEVEKEVKNTLTTFM